MLPIHVDEALLALDKPAGLLSVPGRTQADCMAARVQMHWPDARVVHRLDQATSGLLLFARGPEVQRMLSAAFAERTVDKRYVAIVEGIVADDAGVIDLPLAADWPNRPRQRIDPDQGRPSTTHWRVVARDPERGRTRLELRPLSGRSHQLRVHLQAIGHPVCGDALYGDPAAAPRLLLHASGLRLVHPTRATPLQLLSEPPF